MITPIGGDERVQRQQSERRRAIDQDVVVALRRAFERVAQHLLTANGAEQHVLSRRQIDRRWGDIHAGCLRRHDDVVEGDARSASASAIERSTLRRLMPSPDGQVCLRIHVDAQNPIALLGQRTGEIDRRRRLAHAPLLVGDGDHVRHRGITSGFEDGSGPVRGGGGSRHGTPPTSTPAPGYPHALRVVHRILWISEDPSGERCGWLSWGCPCAKTAG